MHYVNKRKIALQNKPNLAKCAQNCEKVNNLISILKAKFWLEHFFILQKIYRKNQVESPNDASPLQPLKNRAIQSKNPIQVSKVPPEKG